MYPLLLKKDCGLDLSIETDRYANRLIDVLLSCHTDTPFSTLLWSCLLVCQISLCDLCVSLSILCVCLSCVARCDGVPKNEPVNPTTKKISR